jgi:hypothetical protein
LDILRDACLSKERQELAGGLAAAGSDTGDYGVEYWNKGPRQMAGFDASETDTERARANRFFDAVIRIFA